MIVRVENFENSDMLFVVGELEDFKGKVSLGDFVECIEEGRDSFIEDGYEWWHVSKQITNKYIK